MATLQRWGNSLAIRLPKPMVEQLGLKEGADLDLRLTNGSIVISRSRRRYTLDELLAQAKPENRPKEVDWGPPVGREVIDD